MLRSRVNGRRVDLGFARFFGWQNPAKQSVQPARPKESYRGHLVWSGGTYIRAKHGPLPFDRRSAHV